MAYIEIIGENGEILGVIDDEKQAVEISEVWKRKKNPKGRKVRKEEDKIDGRAD